MHSQSSFVSVFAACAALSAFAFPANAAPDIQGIWYDHEGRGAVEIKPCKSKASRLCGHVVYVKKARNKKRCGTQIIGNVKSNGWGWIYSPKRGRSFPLKVSKLSNDRLRIVGNAGSRFFSRTFTWKRAPQSVVNCGAPAVTAKANAKPIEKTARAPAAVSKPQVTTARVSETPAATSTTPLETTTKSAEVRDTEPSSGSPSAALLTATQSTDDAGAAVDTDAEATGLEASDAEAGSEGDDLAPPGGLSKPKLSLATIENKIRKFVKRGGKSKGKCKYRIPYVGRTINVPCK